MNPHNPTPTPASLQMGAVTLGPTAAAQQRGPTSDVALDGDTKTLTIKLGNIAIADAVFLAGVVALFADPAQAAQLAAFKQGALTVAYTPRAAREGVLLFGRN